MSDLYRVSQAQSIRLLTAEIAMDGKLGFMNVTLWASSSRDAIRRLEAYLGKYNWTLLSTDRAITVDPLHDYEDAVNELIAHTLQNRNFIGLGTYFTYPPN